MIMPDPNGEYHIPMMVPNAYSVWCSSLRRVVDG